MLFLKFFLDKGENVFFFFFNIKRKRDKPL